MQGSPPIEKFSNHSNSPANTLIVFPNCKINLGLSILRKREDGFHDLETVFYPVMFREGLEIIHETDAGGSDCRFTSTGIDLDIPPDDNICIRAYRLLKKDIPALPAARIHLHKRIPSGAGLGGGSSDGAATLLLLNKKFNLSLNDEQLMNYALQLGSDCPFFIRNQPSLARGRGEILTSITLDLSQYKLLLINPRIHISTAWAFSRIQPFVERESLEEIIRLPVPEWRHKLSNDFEPTVFQAYPEIGQIKSELYEAGALYASMSGTGSTVYGIFEKNKTVATGFPSHYFTREI